MKKSSTVVFDGIGPVLFETSLRAKHLNITVRPFSGVRVAVPRGVSFARAEKIVVGKLDWIKKHLRRARTLETAAPSLPAIDRNQAKEVLTARLKELAVRHGFTYNRVFIRFQRTRWGSCSAKNNISLNAKLLHLPGELIDYVLLHELVHTRIKNHSPRFWAALDRFVGDAKSFRKRLGKYRIV